MLEGEFERSVQALARATVPVSIRSSDADRKAGDGLPDVESELLAPPIGTVERTKLEAGHPAKHAED